MIELTHIRYAVIKCDNLPGTTAQCRRVPLKIPFRSLVLMKGPPHSLDELIRGENEFR